MHLPFAAKVFFRLRDRPAQQRDALEQAFGLRRQRDDFGLRDAHDVQAAQKVRFIRANGRGQLAVA
jgi:hypothetical protein